MAGLTPRPTGHDAGGGSWEVFRMPLEWFCHVHGFIGLRKPDEPVKRPRRCPRRDTEGRTCELLLFLRPA